MVPVYLGKQPEGFRRQTVGACADDETLYPWIVKDRIKFFPQQRRRSVSISVILKISQIFGFRPFFRQEGDLFVDGRCKFAGT